MGNVPSVNVPDYQTAHDTIFDWLGSHLGGKELAEASELVADVIFAARREASKPGRELAESVLRADSWLDIASIARRIMASPEISISWRKR